MKSENRNIKLRSTYAFLMLAVIALGIISRQISFIPLLVGDILYAIMMFLFVKILLIRVNHKYAALISLSMCYLIEFSQLYSASWITQIRNNSLGALVLGHGFLWIDIVAYTIGTAICVLVSRKVSTF